MRPAAALFSLLGLLVPAAVAADAGSSSDRFWLVGAQVTGIAQTNTRVTGPYDRNESFGFRPAFGWSTTTTVAGALSPWSGTLFVIMPEWADGTGLPNPTGLAGYVNGELVRVTKVGLAPYIGRIFLHHDIPLGECSEEQHEGDFEERFLPSGSHAFAKGCENNRMEVTIGRFVVSDFFDASQTGSDPRHRFLNWALMQQGAWDASADTRGFTWGLVVDVEQPRWAVRAGVTLMPTEANGIVLDTDLVHARSEIIETEARYSVLGQPGSARLLFFANHARMGRYRDAIDAAPPGEPPDVDAVRRVGALKVGLGLLVDQSLGGILNVFARAGWNNGATETFCFTEIDRSLSFGGELVGSLWDRAADRVGFGFAASGLSQEHADYLARGGHGFQLGDGVLRYGWELIGELYYAYVPIPYLELTADVQGFVHPGMNRERGPGAVFSVRLHAHY